MHENVIEIHGVAETEDSPYLVMKYVRGASLQKRLEQKDKFKKQLKLQWGV